jgi:SAM-dependent methyltransferase
MDFSLFDKRGYPALSVRDGYSEWARTYEATVLDLMDLALFDKLETVAWRDCPRAADLACGTGRIGVWLRTRGAGAVDGVDLTPAMLERAKAKGVYDRLVVGDVAASGLPGGAYDLVTMSLADEHLATLGPVYREAARLLGDRGSFALAGYHPHFLMLGVPTHFNRAGGAPAAIESHVHLASDHVRAARAAGFSLLEMEEAAVDDAWIASKPKWESFRGHPVSFAFVWGKN